MPERWGWIVCNGVFLDNGAGGTGRGAKGHYEEIIIFLRNKSDSPSPDKNYLLPSHSNHHWVPLLLPHTPFPPPFVDCCVLSLFLCDMLWPPITLLAHPPCGYSQNCSFPMQSH